MCATSRSLRKVIQIEKRMRCGSHAVVLARFVHRLARFVHHRRLVTDFYFIPRYSKKDNRPMRPISGRASPAVQTRRLAGKHPGAREHDQAGHEVAKGVGLYWKAPPPLAVQRWPYKLALLVQLCFYDRALMGTRSVRRRTDEPRSRSNERPHSRCQSGEFPCNQRNSAGDRGKWAASGVPMEASHGSREWRTRS